MKNTADTQNFLLIAGIALTMSACLCISLMKPLWDIDLWWHLATGKYIATHQELLRNDPFDFTTSGAINPERRMLLNYCWLAQVIFYKVYQIGGLLGLVALRVTILATIPLMTFLFCIKRRIPWHYAVPFVTLGGWLTLNFTGERPQLFSFLFAAILVLLLEATGFARKDSKQTRHNLVAAALIPLLMLIWANIHPGYILGTVLLALYLAGESAKLFFLNFAWDRRRFYRIAGLLAIGILFTLLNPNGMVPYLALIGFEGTHMQQISSEYLSPLTLLLQRTNPLYPFWTYLLLAILVLGVRCKAIDLTHWLIVGFLLAISVQSFRYVPFFVLGTAPFLAGQAALAGARRTSRICRGIAISLVVLTVASTIRTERGNWAHLRREPFDTSRFPEQAASFILADKPAGRIFNHFNWGGYLIWKLWPDYQVFIDGRTLSHEAFDEYTRILWDEVEGKKLLDRNDVNIVVIPGVHYLTGELYALAEYLYRDPQWHLVYADDTALVLLRGEANRTIIERRALPKTVIYDHVIARARQLKAAGINTPHLWMALATAYQKKGLSSEAMKALETTRSLK